MCGILAVFCSFLPRELQKILLASKMLKKRGPDSCGSYIKHDGIFIFHRLSINDLVGGDQPMYMYEQNRQIIMMCNGQIYNHKELAEKYEIKCESKSDCEIIMHLYKKIGFVETYKELDGYFSMVIIDNNMIYFACDKMGVRPLYIGETKEYYAVSSLPEVLLEFSENVRLIKHGTCYSIDKKDNKLTEVFHDKIQPIIPLIKEDPEKVIREVLFKAVQKRLMTDRPIACLLSGGLDSSIITAILCKFIGASNVKTYSIGMPGSTDLFYAKMLAKHLGTNHTEVNFTFEDGFAIIPEVIRTLGTYDITTIRASVGMYLLGKYISKNSDAKVIFSGEGSDELFMGYLYFHNSPSIEESQVESLRLLDEMCQYDILRADRTISSNGLELRLPFLDNDVVNTVLALLPIDVVPDTDEKIEKNLLRVAFKDLLPEQILWRRKEGFSDGVSSMEKPLYIQIQEKLEKVIPDILYNSKIYISKEAMYYKLIFGHYFPNYNLSIPYWMPRWTDVQDPSGRLIHIEKGTDVQSVCEDELSMSDQDEKE